MPIRTLARSLILAAVPLLACSDSGVGVGPGPLRLELTLNQTTLERSDSVMISLRLSNVSIRPVSVTSPDNYGLCRHAFEVADHQDHEVVVNTALCALMSLVYWPPIELAPGASVTIEDRWLPSSSFLDGQALAPGKYRLVGRITTGDGKPVRSSAVDITLVP